MQVKPMPERALDSPRSSGATAGEIAEYIEEMAGQLAHLADGGKLERLRDLLRLARDEAHRCVSG